MSCYYINQVWYFFKHNTWYIKLNPNFSYFLTAIKILISDSKLHVNWQFTSHHICTTNKFFDRTYFCFLVIILGYVHVSKGIITNSNRTLLWSRYRFECEYLECYISPYLNPSSLLYIYLYFINKQSFAFSRQTFLKEMYLL